jgi:hypothetical protein
VTNGESTMPEKPDVVLRIQHETLKHNQSKCLKVVGRLPIDAFGEDFDLNWLIGKVFVVKLDFEQAKIMGHLPKGSFEEKGSTGGQGLRGAVEAAVRPLRVTNTAKEIAAHGTKLKSGK